MNTWLPLVIGAIMGLGGIILGLFAKAKSKAVVLERDAARRNAEVWHQGQVTAADAAGRAGEVAAARARDVAERDAALVDLAHRDRDAADRVVALGGGVLEDEVPAGPGPGGSAAVPERSAPADTTRPVRGRK